MSLGLLEKAKLLSQTKSLCFTDFIKENKLSCFLILNKIDDQYFCQDSYNLDGNSIISCNSTKAFWDGLINEDKKIYNFKSSDNSISPFLQLFSTTFREEITFLGIYKISENQIFISVNCELSEKIVHDFLQLKNTQIDLSAAISALKNNYSCFKYELDFSEAAESFISQLPKDKKKYSEQFLNAISEELSHRFEFYFQNPNLIQRTGKQSMKFIMFSKCSLNETLLLNHLIKSVAVVLDDYSQLISLSFNSIATTENEIKDFFKVK